MTDKKLTFEEIKKLNAERTQGDWDYPLSTSKEGKHSIKVMENSLFKDLIASQVNKNDVDFLTNAPQIAKQYIWLVEKLQWQLKNGGFIGEQLLRELLKALEAND